MMRLEKHTVCNAILCSKYYDGFEKGVMIVSPNYVVSFEEVSSSKYSMFRLYSLSLIGELPFTRIEKLLSGSIDAAADVLSLVDTCVLNNGNENLYYGISRPSMSSMCLISKSLFNLKNLELNFKNVHRIIKNNKNGDAFTISSRGEGVVTFFL